VTQAAAQTYVMILAPNSGIAFVRDVRAAGDRTLKLVRLDLGGYRLDFSGADNVGSRYVDVGVIDQAGQLRY